MSDPKNEEKKKGLFASMANAVSSGIDSVTSGIDSVTFGLMDGTAKVGNMLSEGTQSLLTSLEKTNEMFVDQVTGAVGYVKDGVYYIGDKAVEGAVIAKDGVLTVGGNVVGTIINTSKFIGDSEYRNKEGIPWLKGIIDSNQKILVYQMNQNSKTLGILYDYSMGKDLPPEQMEIATKQLTDMAKLVPALAIFLLPGGMVLLPLLGKLLPWDLIPDLKPPEEGEQKADSEGKAKSE